MIVDDADGVRTITINRPEVKNALTAAMRARFSALIDEADADDAVRAVIVTAVDPVFSAGVDFKEVAAGGGSPSSSNPGAALRAATTPVVCAVNGACVTGALELALSCTFIVASERARFADTHARLDVVAAWGLTALLPRAVGVRKAAELSITGNFVDADEALRIGLVNHVVGHDELLPFTRSLVARHRAAPARSRRCSTSTGAATACRWTTRSDSRRSTPRVGESIRPRSAPPVSAAAARQKS